MTPEHLENTMQFIVEQQAQLTAMMHRHDDAIADLETSRAKTEQEIQTATGLIGRLAVAMTQLTERTDSVASRVDKIEVIMDSVASRMDSVARRIDNLTELQEGTEERLNSFITFVEKYISSRNGGSKSTN